MSDPVLDQLVSKLSQVYGRRINIVSGKDSYSFNKDTHRKMINNNGMYLLLENIPLDTNRKYDKAFLVPASTIDSMLPTNNPNAVKSSFSLSGSKVRMVFFKQCVKLYEALPIIVRPVDFNTPRKTVRIEREDWVSLGKTNGEFVYICTIKPKREDMVEDTDILVGIIRVPANSFNIPLNQKSTDIPLDLNGEMLTIIQNVGYTVTRDYGVMPFKKESVDTPPAFVTQNPPKLNDTMQPNSGESIIGAVGSVAGPMEIAKFADAYALRGKKIKVTIPDGEHSILMELVITEIDRVHN
jgi:hypothetical protein